MAPDPAQPAPPIHEAASRRDWPAYFDRIEGKPPRATTQKAIDRFENGASLAIDLGCGSGRDCQLLLESGWRVLAIDASEDGLDRLRNRPVCAQALEDGRLETVQAEYGDFALPACGLLNASFSLPFCPPDRFEKVWADAARAIEPGGRFAGQLFGDRDDWAILEDRTHLSRADAVSLFDGFVLEHFEEEDRPGTTAGQHHKHWHVYHIVARKRGIDATQKAIP